MAVFYTDTGSFGNVAVAGTGSNILVVSGSGGGLFQVSDLTGSANLFTLTSGSTTIFNVDTGSNVIISGSLNVQFGMTGSLFGTASYAMSVGGGPVESYFNYPALFNATTTISNNTAQQFVQPFILPYDISVSYLRVNLTVAANSTNFGTTANTTVNLTQGMSWYANLYTQGTGANSRSLQQFAQGSTFSSWKITGSIGAASNNQTVAMTGSFPVEGGVPGYFTSTYNVNNASMQISSAGLTNMTANKFLDIPFATSLSAGQYWLAFAKFSTTATTGPAAFTNVTMNNSFYAVSQASLSFGFMGSAAASSLNLQKGMGIWTTGVANATTVSMGLNNVSMPANSPYIYFQMIREA